MSRFDYWLFALPTGRILIREYQTRTDDIKGEVTVTNTTAVDSSFLFVDVDILVRDQSIRADETSRYDISDSNFADGFQNSNRDFFHVQFSFTENIRAENNLKWSTIQSAIEVTISYTSALS